MNRERVYDWLIAIVWVIGFLIAAAILSAIAVAALA